MQVLRIFWPNKRFFITVNRPSATAKKLIVVNAHVPPDTVKTLAWNIDFTRQSQLSACWFVFIFYDLFASALPLLLTALLIPIRDFFSGTSLKFDTEITLSDEKKSAYSNRSAPALGNALCDINPFNLAHGPCSLELRWCDLRASHGTIPTIQVLF